MTKPPASISRDVVPQPDEENRGSLPTQTGPVPIAVGLDLFLERLPTSFPQDRWGLLCNQASLDASQHYAWDAISRRYPGKLAALFTPQHGLFGEQQANMIESDHGFDSRLNVPIHSLYSEVRSPTPQMLSQINGLVIDLQDVGTRVYTFIWTMLSCLRACAEHGIPVLVLDRPNPLGGECVEGPAVQPQYFSFVGNWKIPMRHGLTMAELAQLLNAELDLRVDLHVLPMQGWLRSMFYPQTGRVWWFPSPNLPTFAGVLCYPGMVLLEGTNISEGRGTTVPFQVCGAPFIEEYRLYELLESLALPGVSFRPLKFVPTFDKWQGQSCGGVALHVIDAKDFRPYFTALNILFAIRSLYPQEFRWRDPPYEYDDQHLPIDILTGSSLTREWLDAQPFRSPADQPAWWHLDSDAWWQRVQRHMLY